MFKEPKTQTYTWKMLDKKTKENHNEGNSDGENVREQPKRRQVLRKPTRSPWNGPTIMLGKQEGQQCQPKL